MYQDISLVAGTATVSFWAQKWPAAQAIFWRNARWGKLTIGGDTKITPASTWTQYTTAPIAVTGGTRERLQITSDPYVGTLTGSYLDDVSVSNTAVPEPGTLLLLGTGLLGLLTVAWAQADVRTGKERHRSHVGRTDFPIPLFAERSFYNHCAAQL